MTKINLILIATICIWIAASATGHAQAPTPASVRHLQIESDKRAISVLPPIEFDRPYEGKLAFEYVDTIAELHKICAGVKTIANTKGMMIGACTFVTSDLSECRIYALPDTMIAATGVDPSDLRRHEIGHCNGWKHG